MGHTEPRSVMLMASTSYQARGQFLGLGKDHRTITLTGLRPSYLKHKNEGRDEYANGEIVGNNCPIKIETAIFSSIDAT